MTALIDQPERDLIRGALDRSTMVEAAAGTGKTTELLNRIVNVLGRGPGKVHEVVAVTFTDKAAGELKLRLRSELEAAASRTEDQAERHNLEEALKHLEEARINTIHGFCVDLLHERPVEAKVDPQFAPIPDPDAKRLYAEAFNLWLQEKLEDPPEGVRRSLRRASEKGPVDRLKSAGLALIDWRDHPAAWSRPAFNREEEIDDLVDRLEEFADLTSRPASPSDPFYHDTGKVRRVSEAIRTLEKARAREGGAPGQARDYDGLEAEFVRLAFDSIDEYKRFRNPRKGYRDPYGDGVRRTDVLQAHEALVGRLEAFAEKADADLAALLHSELRESLERYEELKARLGKLDFLDLLVRTRDMLCGCREVRQSFQRRFKHIFIDEFQDTDPLQVEIMLLLASEDPAVDEWRKVKPAPGKLFIVGDPKQAIYRFRRADLGVYLEVKKLLEKAGALSLKLTTSFRAVPAIQKAVNRAFAPVMTGDAAALEADYVPLSSYREDRSDQPALVALPIPAPYGRSGKLAASAIENSLPDAVAGLVEWLINHSGWTVTERESPDKRVPITPRHICLLLRRFEKSWSGDTTGGYIEALEAREIPHLLVGGKSFHVREEVETVRAALAAIEWPDDELSVFAALRGSFFSVGDEALLEYRHLYRRLHPFRIPENSPPHLLPVVEALRLLQSLHRNRNYRPVAETLAELLEVTRAYAGFALRPRGQQALANVLHIAELARNYDASGSISFRGFVERLREDAESGETPEAPILEERGDGVRIISVHRAKGLEFPVVILADVTAKLTAPRASRYLSSQSGLCALRIGGWSPTDLVEHNDQELARERAEGIRVAYVAATRARDLLVVPAIGDDPFEQRWESVKDWWISPLNSAIYPEAHRRRDSVETLGAPAFGEDSVVVRPDGKPRDSINVRPGLHTLPSPLSEGSPYGVVWWDPTKLRLDVPRKFGVHPYELLEKVDQKIVEHDLKAYHAWRERRNETIRRGSAPTRVVQTATESAARQKSKPEGVRVIEVGRELERPAGRRFGALVHAVLAVVSLEASPKGIEEAATLQGRILGAARVEVASARTVVEAVLQHPLIVRAQKSARLGHCRREAPVTLKGGDGAVLEGVVDIAFLENDTWTVVDFKTDRELEKKLEDYMRQVSLYATAISIATQQKALPVLMRV